MKWEQQLINSWKQNKMASMDWPHTLHELIIAIGKDAPATVMVIAALAVGWKVFQAIWSKYYPPGQTLEPRVILGINEEFRQINEKYALIDNRLESIEEKVQTCREPCYLHDERERDIVETKDCLAFVKEKSSITADQTTKILTIVRMIVKGDFIHKHEEDGKILKIPTGLEDLLDADRNYQGIGKFGRLGKKS